MTTNQALTEIFNRKPLPEGINRNHQKRWKEGKLKETAICDTEIKTLNKKAKRKK